MAKLKYYALCSKNINAAKRHLARIPKEDLVIVINTLLDTDERWAFHNQTVAWCEAEGIEHYVTESDGTPSTGKNSVFDLFLASDNDYMVLVDGDDFITPHGLVVYDMIAQSDNPPDAVALEYQYGLVPNEGYHPGEAWMHLHGENVGKANAADITNPDHIHGFGLRIFQHPYDWWQKALAGESVKVWDEFTQECSDAHQKLYTYEYNNINGWESHLRITFYSRHGATYRFDPELLVGEDTMQYFRMKYDMSLGTFDLRHLNEIYPTYVYDQRIEGIVRFANERDDGRGWLNWMNKLNDEFDKWDAAGKFVDVEVPSVDLPDFADDYRPDTLGLVNYPHKNPRY